MDEAFPKYFKSVDVDGNVIALICRQEADSIIILSPIKSPAGDAFDVQIHEVTNDLDLKNKVSGTIVPASAENYDDVLYNQWKFDGASSFRATTQISKEFAVADNENNNPGSDLDGTIEDTGMPTAEGGAAAGLQHVTGDVLLGGNAEINVGTSDDAGAINTDFTVVEVSASLSAAGTQGEGSQGDLADAGIGGSAEIIQTSGGEIGVEANAPQADVGDLAGTDSDGSAGSSGAGANVGEATADGSVAEDGKALEGQAEAAA